MYETLWPISFASVTSSGSDVSLNRTAASRLPCTLTLPCHSALYCSLVPRSLVCGHGTAASSPSRTHHLSCLLKSQQHRQPFVAFVPFAVVKMKRYTGIVLHKLTRHIISPFGYPHNGLLFPPPSISGSFFRAQSIGRTSVLGRTCNARPIL